MELTIFFTHPAILQKAFDMCGGQIAYTEHESELIRLGLLIKIIVFVGSRTFRRSAADALTQPTEPQARSM